MICCTALTFFPVCVFCCVFSLPQMCSITELFATFWTNVWLLSSVRLKVSPHNTSQPNVLLHWAHILHFFQVWIHTLLVQLDNYFFFFCREMWSRPWSIWGLICQFTLGKNLQKVCTVQQSIWLCRCYEVTLLDAHWREVKQLFRM